MNSIVSKSKWPLPSGAGKASSRGNDALDTLYVRIEQFASVLQEKYGLSRAEAMRKVAALKRAFDMEG